MNDDLKKQAVNAILTAAKALAEKVNGSTDPIENRACALREISETLLNLNRLDSLEEEL